MTILDVTKLIKVAREPNWAKLKARPVFRACPKQM